MAPFVNQSDQNQFQVDQSLGNDRLDKSIVADFAPKKFYLKYEPIPMIGKYS